MQMNIDEKEFKTYILDNTFTINRRYALSQQTIPDFIYLEKTDNNNYKSINLINIIKGNNYDTDKSLEDLKSINDKYFKLSILNLMCLLCYLKYSSRLPEGNNIGFYPFNNFISKHNILMQHVDVEIPIFIKSVKDKLNNMNNIVKNETLILQDFEKNKGVASTDLDILKIKKEYTYTIDIDSCSFFDNIKLSNDIPFASVRDFYKIYKGFKPLTKWIFLNDDINTSYTRNTNILSMNKSEKDILTLKVSNVKNTPMFKEYEKDIFDESDIETVEKIALEQNKKNDSIKDEIYTDVHITFKSVWDEYLEQKAVKDKIVQREKQRIILLNIVQEKKTEDKTIEPSKIKRKGKGDKPNVQNVLNVQDTIKQQQEAETELEKRKIEIEQEETLKQKRKEYKMTIVIDTKITNKDGELNEKELLLRVLSCFNNIPTPIRVSAPVVEKQIQSEFYIPNQLTDFSILKDMIFNDPMFKRYIQLDERLSIHKYKKNMYCYFISDNDEQKTKYIAFSITQKKVEKTDTKIIAKDQGLSIGTFYLNVKIIRCTNMEETRRFKNIFCKYIDYYNKNKDKVINDYAKILNDPNIINKLLEEEKQYKEPRRAIRQKQLLKDIDPKLFFPGYARICEQKYAPKILNDNEIETFYGDNATEDNIDKRKHIMLYPKTPEEGKQYYYSCLNNKHNHLYPGLQRNYLDNFDKYPIVPCCFVSDQSKKTESPFDLYYGDRNMNYDQIKDFFLEKDEQDSATHIITTQKFIPPGRFGVLPKDIISYLHSIDPSNKYYRKGSLRSIDSVIDVLLYARKRDYDSLSVSEKNDYIKKIKKQMIDLLLDNNIIFLQESYNTNMLQIIKDNNYLDPHVFYPLLQHIFKCNIILFTRNQQYPDGVLSCPFYDKEYLKFIPDNQLKYVLIYEHMGAETDNAKYPQCEVIFKHHNNIIHPTFTFGSFIEKINNNLSQIYPIRLFTHINSVFSKYNVISYGINEAGKTIYLTLKRKDKLIYMLTDPLPNMNCDVNQTVITLSKYNNFNDPKTAFEFGKDENINLTSFVKNGIFYGFQGNVNDFKFYIPVQPKETTGNVPDNIIDFPIIESKNNQIAISKLDVFNEYKIVSRLLVEYFYYLFSVDYNIYKPNNIDNQYIQNFINRNVKLQSQIDYEPLLLNGQIFNISIFKKDDKYELPVPNTNVLNKLVYNLKLKLDREHNKLFNYHNLEYVPSSYSEVDDFKNSLENNYIVIKGKYPMIQWIKAGTNNYNVYNFVQLPNISVYHEINNIIDEKQKNNLLLLVFVSKWSNPSKNIQNKLYSNKTRKLIFDKYKEVMTIVYIDIDNHKTIADYFNIKSLPTFIFSELDHTNFILKIVSRIEGDIKTFKNLKLLNSELKNILKDTDLNDNLTNVINKANDDKELDQNIDKILEDIFENIDLDEQEESEEPVEPVEPVELEEPEEEKRDDSEEPELSSFFSQYQRSSQ
uniref:Thioredoxin domain-containing protein n=1 Tax=viral metagenome TaxID=1070528 RepID=A0A6C0I4T8_9ZZZZ